MRLFILLGATLMLSACYSYIPVEIRDPIPDNPPLPQVRRDTQSFIGRSVRWGGTIVNVENKENETWIELVAKDLGAYGQPHDTDASDGRFIARVTGFLDPAIYSEGRKLTVYGRIEDGVERPIGEKRYSYPLVGAVSVFLWPDDEDRYYASDPYFFPRHLEPYPYYEYYDYYYGYPYWPLPRHRRY